MWWKRGALQSAWCLWCLCCLGWMGWVDGRVANAQGPTSRPAVAEKKMQPQGSVFVGLQRLHTLMASQKPSGAPAWMAGEAHYTGEIVEQTMNLSVVRHILVEPSKPAWVPLGGQGGVVWDVRVGDRIGLPVRWTDGRVGLWLPKGKHLLRYRLQLPIPKSRGEHTLALSLPPSPQAQLHLRFQGPDWSVHTEPASQVIMTYPKGQTHATLRLPTGGHLLLHWKGKRIERDEQTRFRASLQQWVTLQERMMSVRAKLQLEVVTGALRQVRCKVPADLEILHIDGKGVTEWFQERREGDQQIILVQFGYAVREKQEMTLQMERTRLQAGRPVKLPTLQVLGAEEVNGDIGVQARADTEVSHDSAQGAIPVDVRSLPPTIRQGSDLPILLAYRFEQADWDIQVRVVKHPPLKVISIVVNQARFETVYTRTGREVTKATWWVTNNRRQFMPIFLDEKADLLGAFVAGNAVQVAEQAKSPTRAAKQAKHPTKERLFLLPLVRSKSSRSGKVFPVEVLYTVKRAPLRAWGTLRTALPRTPLEVLSFQWNVYLARTHRMIWQDGDVLPKHRRRLLRYLDWRIMEDLKSGTPVLWAGGTRKNPFGRYSSMGLKERFAAPAASPLMSDVLTTVPKTEYRSRFAQVQWQVRTEIPLVGNLISLQGHMLRDRAPHLEILYLQEIFLSFWFWVVWLTVTALVWLFLRGSFAQNGVRWDWLLFSVVGLLALFVAGFFLPMTYLAALRGFLLGVWLAFLYRSATNQNPIFPLWASLGRNSMIFLTFVFLLEGSIYSQILCCFLAAAFLPALFGRNPQKAEPPPSSSPSRGNSPEKRSPSPPTTTPNTSATSLPSDTSTPATSSPAPKLPDTSTLASLTPKLPDTSTLASLTPKLPDTSTPASPTPKLPDTSTPASPTPKLPDTSTLASPTPKATAPSTPTPAPTAQKQATSAPYPSPSAASPKAQPSGKNKQGAKK
ncbi:hypothetical protein L6R29_21005 [Myxococcota bacterium]|nr:hypothetical protein [Myxococcota bacterium]